MLVPKLALNVLPTASRPWKLRYASSAAAEHTPQTFPMPPRITMQRMKIEMFRLEVAFGNVAPL